MKIGRLDSKRFDARRLAPEAKVAAAVSFLLYAAIHLGILLGWIR